MPYRVSCPSRPRSPVITVVSSWSFSHRSSRLNSFRTIASSPSAPNSTSIVSRTTRRAPTDCTAEARRMNRPSRSKSPVVDDLGRIDPDRVDDQAPGGLESGQVEAERGDVRRQVGGRLLERQQDAGLVELLGAAHQELEPEQRLARTRASGDQGRPAVRQPPAGELVEPPDARRRLGQRGSDGRRCPRRVDRRRHRTSRVDLIKLVAMTRTGEGIDAAAGRPAVHR